MKKPNNVIKVYNDDQILSGKSLLFRSSAAALAASLRVTTNPGVTEFWSASEDGQWYAADGDHWISNDGERGQHLYGRGGRLLVVVEIGVPGAEER